MSSPFPGMDPYLEGHLWPDLHHRLATQISDQLTPRLRPRYVARIEVQFVYDEAPEGEIGIMYPDVEIVRSQRSPPLPTPRGGVLVMEPPVATPPSIAVPIAPVEVRVATVEIRDVAGNQLVASIEILSPVNKREPGLGKYADKLRRLRAAHVHIIEIDLLRRGQRLHNHPRIATNAYRVMLIRAGSSQAQVWAINLADLLPVVPVPLRTPDADIPLDLGLALRALYDAAAYDLSIDYTQPPPPPPLSSDEEAWIQTLLEHPQ